MFGYRKASADIDPCKEFLTLSQRWIRLHAVSPPTLRMTDTDPLLCKRSSRVCLTQHKSELTFSVTARCLCRNVCSSVQCQTETARTCPGFQRRLARHLNLREGWQLCVFCGLKLSYFVRSSFSSDITHLKKCNRDMTLNT